MDKLVFTYKTGCKYTVPSSKILRADVFWNLFSDFVRKSSIYTVYCVTFPLNYGQHPVVKHINISVVKRKNTHIKLDKWQIAS